MSDQERAAAVAAMEAARVRAAEDLARANAAAAALAKVVQQSTGQRSG
ncbi:hypothetical protein ABZ845_30850 [Streptomyces sp. NPDC047022]